MRIKKYNYNLGLLFDDIASEQSSQVAIKFTDNTAVSYQNLKESSNSIARYMLNHGVKSGDIVAIFNEKTQYSYSIMIACLKIGATYTNLDPNSPIERLHKMLQVCEPKHYFVNDDKYVRKLGDVQVLKECITLYSSKLFTEELKLLGTDSLTESEYVNGDMAAYLMFTSGSTGFPKGVIISHASVLNFIHWAKTTFKITSDDVLTNLNPMHFDNSVFDFYASLFNGAAMIAVPEPTLRVPRTLLDTLNPLNPTIWFSVPSLLVYITKMRAWKEADLSKLRTVSFGGEGYPKSQLRALWAIMGERVNLVNVYGPTEGTCICSSYPVSKSDLEVDELLPLGPLAPNFDFLIMTNKQEKVDPGEIGELCLIGPNVAKGYYNNWEKSQEVFIRNPYCKAYNQIMYRTGDLVKFDEHENMLYFCGRTDNQIKRMGYRIELEEIEAALGSLEQVNESAIVYHKMEESNGKIIACVCGDYSCEAQILLDLRDLLPMYMIPNEVVFLRDLPKNQNGKIDRLALKKEFCK
ncbi:hypothetical protein A1QO_10595 [Vibrio genomosp. F10 str. ZF-129]|uniref:D-alanine--poly(Phosphoribitol) ligase n=1 Tax=Vibrio genomosp. F10 str. ZF-129 TaxID=1187848 RepID=A0A1E5BDA4_9VIBR|nr:amino acid adenylation domain-containing protein [Vibrio genomosp. F10]OEE33121.1 hypothetical protein A1QO_10595 [Vibrio genomosp. F10 str. ZF-129]